MPFPLIVFEPRNPEPPVTRMRCCKCIELTAFGCSRIAAVLIRATASDCASADPLSSAGKTVALPLSYTRAVLVYPGKFPGNRENNREFGKTDYLR